ncbi:hypothetical protein [Nocardioides sp. J54]|uniref:hypothetical protein n=1 Tax=Nocardioides sp. J54 TaxID=935866 RepID=UPI00048FB369|nr:hypothetical protein [Nocardioides sp. J54]
MNAAPATTLAPTVKPSWTAADTGGSGIRDYEVRVRKAAWNGSLGAWTTRTTTSTSLTLNLARGSQHFYQVRSRDAALNVSEWSPQKCTALPLDDRKLKASAGWRRATGGGYLDKTVTSTSKQGKSLTLEGVPKGRAALVVSKGRNNGALEVRYGARVVKRISLNGALRHKVVVKLPDLARKSDITIRTTTKRPVRVDGIVVARR